MALSRASRAAVRTVLRLRGTPIPPSPLSLRTASHARQASQTAAAPQTPATGPQHVTVTVTDDGIAVVKLDAPGEKVRSCSERDGGATLSC